MSQCSFPRTVLYLWMEDSNIFLKSELTDPTPSMIAVTLNSPSISFLVSLKIHRGEHLVNWFLEKMISQGKFISVEQPLEDLASTILFLFSLHKNPDIERLLRLSPTLSFLGYFVCDDFMYKELRANGFFFLFKSE